MRVLVRARPLADADEVGPRVTRPEDDRRPPLAELAAPTAREGPLLRAERLLRGEQVVARERERREAEVAGRGTGAFIVGFAAETHDVAENARAKLESKGIDLLVANDVSQQGIGFDADENEVLLLDRWGGTRALPRMPKTDVADAILSHILALRAASTPKKAVR